MNDQVRDKIGEMIEQLVLEAEQAITPQPPVPFNILLNQMAQTGMNDPRSFEKRPLPHDSGVPFGERLRGRRMSPNIEFAPSRMRPSPLQMRIAPWEPLPPGPNAPWSPTFGRVNPWDPTPTQTGFYPQSPQNYRDFR